MKSGITLDGAVRHGLARWRWVAATCLVAMGVAGAVSVAQPKKYTSVARLIVEPGPASPLRNATPQTPQLLAMLAGYDELARGDALFAEVARRTGLSGGDGKGAMATRVLAPARVLEISYTHTSAAKAHEVALALAEETVRRAEGMRKQAAEEIASEAGNRTDEARSWAVYRGARVRLLDAGVVPSMPSSPRILLNVMSAAVLAIALAAISLTVRLALDGAG